MRRAATMHLPAGIRRALIDHALAERPFECCGLLLGAGNRIQFAVPLANGERSPVRFRIDERAHIDLRRALRHVVPPLEIRGVYHSHPDGPPTPSARDVAEAHYPDWLYVIVGLRGRRPSVRGYFLADAAIQPVRLLG